MQLKKYECFDCKSFFYNIESFIFNNVEMKNDENIQEILNYLDWNWKRLRNNSGNWPIPKYEIIEKNESKFGRANLKYREKKRCLNKEAPD